MLYDPKWKPTEEEVQLEEWQKILLKAADIIENGGHCKIHLEDARGRHCALGAIALASVGEKKASSPCDDLLFDELYTPYRNTEAVMKLYEYIADQYPDRVGNYPGYTGVYEFNDDKSTCESDVINAMREAAKQK